MIKKKGDLFETTAPAIGHGVNTKGVMGAGIAKVFRAKYPEMYQEYAVRCEREQLRPGQMMYWSAGDHYVYNMASQEHPGADAQLHLLRFSAFASAADAFMRGFDRIAIPMIGCGIGGLEWDDVEQELLVVEALTGVQFEVWQLPA